MADISKVLESLSPEKRRLLEMKLKKQGGVKNTFPVSFAQQRLWFLYQLEPDNIAYNIPAAVRLNGKINERALKESLNAIIKRHEVLRTHFSTVSGNPMQIVSDKAEIDLDRLDLSRLDRDKVEETVKQEVNKRSAEVFDLNKGPLIKATLMHINPEEHILLIVMHHIISDGWSIGIFVNEFISFYRAISQEKTPDPPPLKIQYADFATWQRKKLQGEHLEKELNFWESFLGKNPPVLELPTDYPRPAVKSFKGSRTQRQLGKDLGRSLQKLAAENGATMFMVLLAVLKTLLYRYTKQEDICIGTPIANRNRAEIEPLIGFFVNTLVLRSDLSGNPSFRDFLEQVRKNSLEAFTHQDIPFEMLVEKLQPERNMSHTPLFQVLFVHQTGAAANLQIPGLDVELVPIENNTSKFDLTFGAAETPDGVIISMEYDSDLFHRETIERMLEHYQILAENAVANPDQEIDLLPFVSGAEKKLLLDKWVSKDTQFAPEFCMHQLFEKQAAKSPEAIAVSFEDQQLTYGILNEKANQLARFLIKKGIQPDDLAGIYLERKSDLLIVLLAVLKAGGAYLPIDPVYPAERVSFMLEDAEAKIILSETSLAERLPESRAEIILIDEEKKPWDNEGTTNPDVPVKPENLIYVIYTSGSTGKPKGTLITHYNVARLMQATEHWFRFDEKDVWTLFHSYAFDFSVWEIWGALIYGGRLVIVPYLISRSPEDFYHLLNEEKVTVLNQTPSAFRQLIHAEGQMPQSERNLSLRTIIFGGEALELNSLRPWFERHGDRKPQLINMYGITETTVHVTYRPITMADVEANSGSVIGEAIPDLQVYILDDHQQPVPIGVPGEIHVGGSGLARGYLKRPELTSTKFIPDPFSGDPDARLYRSGDAARFLANGDLEYIGRIDTQVKIRGFRIELGEIESLLVKHEHILDTVVVTAKDSTGEDIIAAYLIATPGQQPDSAALRDYLRAQLPEYMVPSAFVLMEKFPLTPNGKIDRRALPEPEKERLELKREYVAPKTPTEVKLAAIFSDLLDVPKVGANDNFFDLGGHSLLATRLLSRIKDDFNTELPLRVLFDSAVLQDIAHNIDRLHMQDAGRDSVPLKPVPRTEDLPLSFAQQRLWFLDQMQPGDASYNIPTAYRIEGRLDVELLQRCIDDMVKRHESLRTTFKTVDGAARQIISAETKIIIDTVDLRHIAEDDKEAELEKRLTDEARKPFDLSRGPLTRMSLLQFSEQEYVILLTMHHIISDGWSMGIFVREMIELYRAFQMDAPYPLKPLPIQYADFAHWQRNWLTGEVLENQLNYWKKQLGHGSPVLRLPTDHPRPEVPTSTGKHLSFKFSKSLTQKLAALSKKQDATLFMTLLAAFQSLLHLYSGEDDISVGAPIANRNRSEIESLIGFFVNTLVMRCDLSDDPTFEDLLEQVRESALGAFAHQDIPFEKLVDAIQPERNASHTPLFQVMFVLQNISQKRVEMPEFSMETLAIENGLSQFDLTLIMQEFDDILTGAFEYNADLFEQATIERLIHHFENLLEIISENPNTRLSQINFLTEKEKQVQIRDWNQTQKTFPEKGSLAALFEEQAAKSPQAVALVAGSEQLTYDALNRRANQLASYLRENGIKSETLVGISFERCPELAVALLGVLKAGGAYLPLDTNYPEERLDYMIQDSDVNLVLTQDKFKNVFSSKVEKVLALDSQWPEIAQYNAENLPQISGGLNSAYVIYTSGSTGKPKGVVVNQRGVINHNFSMIDAFKLTSKDRMLQFMSINFDAAVEEFFPTWFSGATLVMRDNSALFSIEELIKLVKKEKLTILDLPTAYWHEWAYERSLTQQPLPESLRLIIIGGDKAEADRFKLWNQHGGDHVKILNTYGPTETTIVSTLIDLDQIKSKDGAPDNVSIGRPIANTRIYILDEHQKMTPIGVPGELCIGGAGLARGYLNRPDLTAERFIPDPFSEIEGARLYRTGDLVRYRSDGNIEFVGRVDHQIKIRGFRVELGEIENCLNQHDKIKEAVVIAREDTPGDKELAAYYITESENELTAADLQQYVKSKLPVYMAPAGYVKMETFPLTISGKIDRRALPKPEKIKKDRQTKYTAPRNEKEEKLAAVWQQVLGVEKIGIHDNFFELGGDSILSIQVIARAKMAGVQITALQLFQHQTIAELAPIAGTAPVIHAEQGLVSGDLPLTPIQHWFFEQEFPDQHHWNQAILLAVKEQLQPDLLRAVLTKIQQHHDVLRMRFRKQGGQNEQWISGDDTSLPFEHKALADTSENEIKTLIEADAADRQRALNLEEGPIWSVTYYDFGAGRSGRLLFIIHHLVVDGVSWRILLEDIQIAYQQLREQKEMALPPKTTSFKHWAEAIKNYAQSDRLIREADFWLKQYDTSATTLPVDFSDGINDERSLAVLSKSLSKELTEDLLQKLPKTFNSQINEVLLAALVRTFGRWIGKHRLLIEMEGHGREDIIEGVDISRTVGWFTTLYPVLLDLTGIATPADSIRSIKEQLRRVPEKGIGYGILRYLSETNEKTDALKNQQVPPINFNYLGQIGQTLPENSPFMPARESSGIDHSPDCKRLYIFEIAGSVAQGKFSLSWAYSKNLHRRETIEQLTGYYMDELKALIEAAKAPQKPGYTPSDFKMSGLDQAKLDKVLGKLGKKK